MVDRLTARLPDVQDYAPSLPTERLTAILLVSVYIISNQYATFGSRRKQTVDKVHMVGQVARLCYDLVYYNQCESHVEHDMQGGWVFFHQYSNNDNIKVENVCFM